MASLLSKLRSQVAQEKTPAASVSTICHCVRQCYPLQSVPAKFSADTLATLFLQENVCDLTPSDLLFFDTETTGLRGGVGTLAFLIGIGFVQGNQFVVEQYLMRDYSEEQDVLSRFLDKVKNAKAIVSYNGASYDLPLLQNRLIMNRLTGHFPKHFDLLPAVRRIYKIRLRQCKLTNLEKEVLGIERREDIPGAEIPERYFSFLRHKRMFALDPVLEHNRQDVLSMYLLLVKMIDMARQPQAVQAGEEAFSLGRVYERRDDYGRAKMCYRMAVSSAVGTEALRRLAHVTTRERRFEVACEYYLHLLRRSPNDLKARIALCKIYEHRLKQPGEALEIAKQGMLYSFSESSRNAVLYQDLLYRHARLLRKVGKEDHGLDG